MFAENCECFILSLPFPFPHVIKKSLTSKFSGINIECHARNTWHSFVLLNAVRMSMELCLQIPVCDREKRSNSPLSILVLGSSSGLLTSALWDIAVQLFIDVVQNCSNYPSKEIILLTDNLGIHRQPDSILKALQRDCYQLYFPPNCSHFIQPLDNLLFASLKHQIDSISSSLFHQHHLWEVTAPNHQEIIVDAIMQLFPSVFTIRNIEKAWDNVGVHPLNPEKIVRRCLENLGKNSAKEDLTKKYAVAKQRRLLRCFTMNIQSLLGIRSKRQREYPFLQIGVSQDQQVYRLWKVQRKGES